ncbi:Uncharacterised protein [Roseburia hominis]|nr:Uncharacterised protein [Roseburia hominis]
MSNSHKIFKNVSKRYNNMITIPLTPFALSSGKATAKIVASNMMLKNQLFSYVVNCLENNNIKANDKLKINKEDARLKMYIVLFAMTCL